jgi:predicted DsbA family dithiol-disulfide isomerase
MATEIYIDFVSDVVCPWCLIGLLALEEAVGRLEGEITVQIAFHPFELNPDMGPDGQLISEHVMEKYGRTPGEAKGAGDAIRARAAALGFEMKRDAASRIYNTFDAHRLLTYAASLGRQSALKHLLLSGYFGKGLNVSDHETLVAIALEAELPEAGVREVLQTDAYVKEVRQIEAFWRQEGVTGVPSLLINQRYSIVGGQPPELFERALRSIAHEMAGGAAA